MALVNVKIKEPGTFVVHISGPLDTATYEEFEKDVSPLLVAGTKAIILDMAQVNYVSSMGVGAIFKVAQAVRAQKGELVMIHLQPQIKKVFDIIKALPGSIFTSVQEADAYLDEIQRKFEG